MNADELYDLMHKHCDDNPYHGAQLHFRPKKAPNACTQAEYNVQQMVGFVQYLHYHAEHWRTDELTSIQRTPNGMHLSEFLKHIEPDSFTGIKFVKYPLTMFSEHDLWNAGYIEGYMRTMTTPDYFFWSYMKADKLKMILSEYTEELQLLS